MREDGALLVLIATAEGLPLGYELRPGATCEGSSLPPTFTSLKKRHLVTRVRAVANSRMLTQKNLQGLRAAGIH